MRAKYDFFLIFKDLKRFTRFQGNQGTFHTQQCELVIDLRQKTFKNLFFT